MTLDEDLRRFPLYVAHPAQGARDAGAIVRVWPRWNVVSCDPYENRTLPLDVARSIREDLEGFGWVRSRTSIPPTWEAPLVMYTTPYNRRPRKRRLGRGR